MEWGCSRTANSHSSLWGKVLKLTLFSGSSILAVAFVKRSGAAVPQSWLAMGTLGLKSWPVTNFQKIMSCASPQSLMKVLQAKEVRHCASLYTVGQQKATTQFDRNAQRNKVAGVQDHWVLCVLLGLFLMQTNLKGPKSLPTASYIMLLWDFG